MHYPRVPAWWCLPLLAVATGCATASSRLAERPDDFVTVELSTVGMDVARGVPVVLLRDPESGGVLPIWVGVAEAHAIARALHDIQPPRPLTHDLLVDLLQELGGQVLDVRVSDVRDGVYYGLIRLRRRGDAAVHDLDSRPSDALALAVRLDVPILVLRTLLQDVPDVEFDAPHGDEQVVQTIGLTVVTPTAELRRSFGLPERDGGVVVTRARGEAARVGLQRGDLIVGVNGVVPHEPMDLFLTIRRAPPDARVRLRYWRQGQERDVELHPGPKGPQEPSPDEVDA